MCKRIVGELMAMECAQRALTVLRGLIEFIGLCAVINRDEIPAPEYLAAGDPF